MPCGDLCATTCLDQADIKPTFQVIIMSKENTYRITKLGYRPLEKSTSLLGRVTLVLQVVNNLALIGSTCVADSRLQKKG